MNMVGQAPPNEAIPRRLATIAGKGVKSGRIVGYLGILCNILGGRHVLYIASTKWWVHTYILCALEEWGVYCYGLLKVRVEHDVRNVVMAKPGGRTGNSPDKPTKYGRGVLPAFRYEDGYTLSASDLGKIGVKIELNHEHDAGVAIILPPEKVAECGRWLLETLEQDSNGLPQQLRDILERLSKQSGFKPTLQRGDKKKIREALKVLNRSQRPRFGAEEPVLRRLPKKAM